ncbi:MAG: AsnC family transcriptional regulator [Spirochaetia bacterium]|nr:AsnC family transcriptional regulator [Spirochaetia bacterium]
MAELNWTFLTNHAHVLLCIAKDNQIRIKDIAHSVGITERAVQAIINDLSLAGFLESSREGRRNTYTIHPEKQLRHPLEAEKQVQELFRLVHRAEKV